MKFLNLNLSLMAVILLTGSVFGGKFPSDISQCKYGDVSCIKDTTNVILKSRPGGEKSLKLTNLSPLKIQTMSIKQGSESPVNIELDFKDNLMYGLDSVVVHKTSGFGEDLKGPHELYLKGPFLSMVGDYTVLGKVLILPIQGTGISNITMENVTSKFSFTGSPLIKDGKTYLKLENDKLRLKAKRIHFNISNLFNGDKALGDNMNKFLNENWADIYGELQEKVEAAFSKVFAKVIGEVFLSHPYNELFIN